MSYKVNKNDLCNIQRTLCQLKKRYVIVNMFHDVASGTFDIMDH